MNNSLIFKQSQVVPILTTIFVTIWFFFLFLMFTQNSVKSLLLTIPCVLGLITYEFMTFKTFLINPDELIIKDRLKEKKVKWTDVLSMSTAVITTNSQINYQIKTYSETITLPIMEKYSQFENQLEQYAHLEKEGSSLLNSPNPFWINFGGPYIQRWKKTGHDYLTTGFSDQLLGLTYPKTIKKHLGLIIAFVIIWNAVFLTLAVIFKWPLFPLH